MSQRHERSTVPLDVRIDSPGREGLTGTAPAELYAPIADREQITIAPDFRPPEEQPAWRQDFPDRLAAGPVRRAARLHEVPGAHERRDDRGPVLDRGAELVASGAAGQPEIRRIAVGRRHRRRRHVVTFNYPGEHDPCVLVRVERVASSSPTARSARTCRAPSFRRPDHGDIHCPCHEGFFDLRIGRPIAGPPRRPLPRVVLDDPRPRHLRDRRSSGGPT